MLNELVEGDAALLLDFVIVPSSVAGGELSVSDWWFLAQGASTRSAVYRGQDDELALIWGRAAVAAYERCVRELRGNQTEQEQIDRHEISAMWLRAWAMQRFGANPHDSMLNPHILENWFLERIPPFLFDRESLRAHDQRLPVDEELAVIYFRQRSEILATLVKAGVIGPDSAVIVWLRRFQLVK